MTQTTTSVNACDAAIKLDDESGIPIDISGSSNVDRLLLLADFPYVLAVGIDIAQGCEEVHVLGRAGNPERQHHRARVSRSSRSAAVSNDTPSRGRLPAKAVEVRLSNLMAFDAMAIGNWGCLPEHYPAVVDLAVSGRIAIEPFIVRRPMHEINDVFETLHHGGSRGRMVLLPEVHS